MEVSNQIGEIWIIGFNFNDRTAPLFYWPEHYADNQQIALIVAVGFHECCNPTCLQSTRIRG